MSGTIADALTQHPEMYTLSLGHMSDLTFAAFAYLKTPLLLASAAFAVCASSAAWLRRRTRIMVLGVAVGMVLFFQASRLALVTFDDYLGSYPLAVALERQAPGRLIEADAYYAFSSVFFYTDQSALLWNGRTNNLEYGSYAPHALPVFLNDGEFVRRWKSADRYYLLVYGTDVPRLNSLLGTSAVYEVAQNSGNFLLSNQPGRK